MICYRDKTFCQFYESCAKAAICPRPLTDEVMAAAERWWGSPAVPISKFAEQPDCHVDNQLNFKIEVGK